MYSLIKISEAMVVEAVVLSATEERMRIAAAGFDDAIELKRIGPHWFSDTGSPVSFEFFASDVADCQAVVTSVRPMTSKAAS